MERLKLPIFNYVFRNRKPFFLLFILSLLLFTFFNEVKAAIVIAVLAFLGFVGQVYKRYIRITSAFEFVTFGTVIAAVAYGPVAGALFALTVSFAAEVISGNIDAFMLVYLPVRILSGVVAALIPSTNIIFIGIATTLFINLLSQPVYLLQGDAEIRLKGAVYFVVNIFFNMLLFNLFGSIVLGFAQ
jgi:hypothetical protein